MTGPAGAGEEKKLRLLISSRKTALSRTETRSQLVQLARLDELGKLVDPVIEDQNV